MLHTTPASSPCIQLWEPIQFCLHVNKFVSLSVQRSSSIQILPLPLPKNALCFALAFVLSKKRQNQPRNQRQQHPQFTHYKLNLYKMILPWVTHHWTDDGSIFIIEIIITHCSPFSFVQQLYPTFCRRVPIY